MNENELDHLLKGDSALPPPPAQLRARVLADAAHIQACGPARERAVIPLRARKHLITPAMGLAASLICGIWVGIGNGYVDSFTEDADIIETALAEADIFSALEEL